MKKTKITEKRLIKKYGKDCCIFYETINDYRLVDISINKYDFQIVYYKEENRYHCLVANELVYIDYIEQLDIIENAVRKIKEMND